MANGVLARGMTQAGQYADMYTVPTDVVFSTASINCCNMGTDDATVRIAIANSAIPGGADHIDFNSVIPANGGILERTCIVCSPSEHILVFCDSSDVAVRIYGLEQRS